MKKKYTHLFFDLDNTLWDFQKNSRYAMEAAFEGFKLGENGIRFDEFFTVYSEFNHRLWTAYRKKEIKKKELTYQRFQFTFDALKITGVDAQEMNKLYLDEMAKQKLLMDGALDLLDYLKRKSYKMYIITNGFKQVQHKKLRNSGLAPYFQKVFISEEIKMPKPGREIFEYAIKSANAKKSHSLMIGDDWDVDVMGAHNFGIDAVYYSKTDKDKYEGTSNSSLSIYNYSELNSLMGVL